LIAKGCKVCYNYLLAQGYFRKTLKMKRIKIDKDKIFLANLFLIFVLLTGMLIEFNLRANMPVCPEPESKEELCKIEEIKANKEKYSPVSFSEEIDIPSLPYSAGHLDSFILIPESRPDTFLCVSFKLFNHSPPVPN
jgi:hypothetical protein